MFLLNIICEIYLISDFIWTWYELYTKEILNLSSFSDYSAKPKPKPIVLIYSKLNCLNFLTKLQL